MILRLKAIVVKEFCHILRDWQTLMIVLAMPVAMMFLYGYALTMDLAEVPVAVIDPDMSPMSRHVAVSLDASPFFSVKELSTESGDPVGMMRRLRLRAIVRFPAAFAAGKSVDAGAAKLQLIIDGSDPNTATVVSSVLGALVVKIASEYLKIPFRQAIDVTPTVLFNPEQKSARFFIPGLMALILMMISALLTSLALTREKESGTIEQLLVSPLRPVEIIIGKIIPYCVLAACDGVVILLAGRYVFGVECAGNLGVLSIFSLLYIITALALGLMISAVATTQQQAMMIVLPATLMPTILLSGFIFPLASLPEALRLISKIVPTTWYIEIIRGVMLKGVGFAQLRLQAGVLTFMALLLIVLSVRKLRVML